MNKHAVAQCNELNDKEPAGALIENVDLVIVRYGDNVSVFYGRCLHRGALLADGHIDGQNLICGVHNWDYRVDTGISEYANDEKLPKFNSWVEDGQVLVDTDEIKNWELQNPQPYNRDAYLDQYADTTGTEDEPHNGLIQSLAKNGLSGGEHGFAPCCFFIRIPRSKYAKTNFRFRDASLPLHQYPVTLFVVGL